MISRIKSFLFKTFPGNGLIRYFWGLRYLQEVFQRGDDSRNGEYQMIASALCGIPQKVATNHFVVDIASSNGVSLSPVLPFFKTGSPGLCVEVDGQKFSELPYMYKNFPNVTLVKTKVTPANIAPLLLYANVPKDFDVLNIDIDSFDLDLATAILSADYRPSLRSIEINEKIPPPLYFNVKFSDEHQWHGSHFYGCSIIAASLELSKFNYFLVGLEGNNALFQEPSPHTKLPRLDPSKAWTDGYKDREDAPTVFAHNSDVMFWLKLEPKEAERAIIEYFANYSGKFELFISSAANNHH